MATQLRSADVVVVGLGAAGGVAVLPLAEAGLDVVGLEAGTWLDRRDFAPDEIRNNYRDWPMLVKKCEQERPTSRATSDQTARRIGSHPMMNAVGGTTLHYWAQSWRLNPWDFKVVSETTRRYGASRLPAGSTVEDWPLDYEELEPFYDRVEYAIGVSGQAGNLQGRIDERGNKYEAPRRREYPMPPLRWTAFNERMADSARGLGWHPFPGPAAINSTAYQGRPGCGYHGFCNKGGCPLDAKNSPHLTTIPRALDTGNLRVVTRAHVTTIEVDGDGRVTGVSYVTGNEEYFQPARVVLVAGYTYENSRLLLLSKSRAYPDGLSNNHGQVGRHYISHHQGAGVGALLPYDTGAWYGLPAQGVAVDDFADDNWDHSDVDFIGGGNLWAMSDRRPISAANMSTYGRGRNWGSAWKRFIRENADRTHSFYIQKTTLPYEDNYLDLDPQYTDPLGFPVIRITGEYKDNERAIAAFMQDRAEEWYREIGAIEITRYGLGGSMGASTHAFGGTRMGDDPETNVVDRWGFSHEAPNLGVLGASVMGTSGARNPTLTAQALAWRTASHLVESWSDISE
ncbi:MAG: GMC family oxidoreductase [Gemmatimonadota bacterium]|jgi:gluconate 2-dehydrogenase alpha chain